MIHEETLYLSTPTLITRKARVNTSSKRFVLSPARERYARS